MLLHNSTHCASVKSNEALHSLVRWPVPIPDQDVKNTVELLSSASTVPSKHLQGLKPGCGAALQMAPLMFFLSAWTGGFWEECGSASIIPGAAGPGNCREAAEDINAGRGQLLHFLGGFRATAARDDT